MSDDASRTKPPELDGFAAAEYEELRALAHSLRRRVAAWRVPGTDSLVHETYLSLKSAGHESWQGRAHFLAVAALQLRHLIVDHARASRAHKRGGDQSRVSLDEDANLTPKPVMDVLVLDQALNRLALHDQRQYRVAELRLFLGLSVSEVGAVLGVSARTVKEDWRLARTWLARELRPDAGVKP